MIWDSCQIQGTVKKYSFDGRQYVIRKLSLSMCKKSYQLYFGKCKMTFLSSFNYCILQSCSAKHLIQVSKLYFRLHSQLYVFQKIQF